MSNEKSKKTSAIAEKVLLSLALLTLGVLFCLQIATDVVSVIIGVALCLLGIAGLIVLGRDGKPLASASGIFDGVIIALGVVFIAEKILTVFVGLTPYIIAVVGAILTVDAFLAKFVREEKSLPLFILKLALGIAAIVLGLCLLLVSGFRSSAAIVFGIILIVGAVVNLLLLVFNQEK